VEKDNRRLQPEHPVLWIVVAGFLVYPQIFGFDLTHWDDLPLLQIVNHLAGGLAGVVQAFKSNAFVSGSGTYYRPLLTLSFMISGLFGGNDLSPQYFVGAAV
jgi:hypothetical protein